MSTTLNSSGVLFPDGTTQTTAITGAAVCNVYTSSTTWNKPSGLVGIKVTVVGGGGGSSGIGSTPSGTYMNGGAGAGGGTAIEYIPAASLSPTVSVTVGSGGSAGGTTSPQAGGTGGTSSFGAFCSATGGAGGGIAAPTSAPSQTYAGSPILGGVGSGGAVNIQGGGGSGASVGMGCVPGGASIFGSGGASVVSSPGNPQNGTSPPANSYGAGAGNVAQYVSNPVKAGGAGASGVVVVEEFY